MKTLRCNCGKTFSVKPESAGKIVTTPCCNTRVRVPADSSVKNQVEPDRIQVQCSCGQAMALARPKGPVEVQCPACQKRMRIGGTKPAQVRQPASRPDDDVFGSLPSAGSPAWPPTSSPRSQAAGAKAAVPRRKVSSAKKRLPRFGVLEDGFGTPILVFSGFVFLGIFSALGIFLFSQANENMARAAASESWQPTDGKILDSGFTVRGIQRRKQAATITVRYEYKIGDSAYSGSTFSFEKQDSYSPNVAEAKLKPYPPGATCTVYYDPESPSESVLIKGVQSSNTFYFWMGLASILCGTVLAIDSWLGAVNAHRFPPPKVPLF